MDSDQNQRKINRFELGYDESLRQFVPEAGTDERSAHPPEVVRASQLSGRPTPEPAGLPVYAPSIVTMIGELAPVPPKTLILGMTDDDLPVLLDLVYPDSASILLIGGPGSGRSRLVHSILASGCLGQSPRSLRLCILDAQLEDFNALVAAPHCYKAARPADLEGYGLIIELVNLTEERRYGNNLGPDILLSLGDLQDVLEALPPEIHDLLFWLICNGPEAGIWTMAQLDPGRWEDLPPGVLEGFGMWLVGNLDDSHPAFRQQNQEVRQAATGLARGGQFCVYTGDQWTPFWIPNPDEDAWRIQS